MCKQAKMLTLGHHVGAWTVGTEKLDSSFLLACILLVFCAMAELCLILWCEFEFNLKS